MLTRKCSALVAYASFVGSLLAAGSLHVIAQFWTKKKVLLAVVAVKVALLATVLRH